MSEKSDQHCEEVIGDILFEMMRGKFTWLEEPEWELGEEP